MCDSEIDFVAECLNFAVLGYGFVMLPNWLSESFILQAFFSDFSRETRQCRVLGLQARFDHVFFDSSG